MPQYNNQGGQASHCETNAQGHQICYYRGPPAQDGFHAYRIYQQQHGQDGQIFDIVEPPCHGRSARCEDCPALSWEATCPAKPYTHCFPSCPARGPVCPGGKAGCGTGAYGSQIRSFW